MIWRLHNNPIKSVIFQRVGMAMRVIATEQEQREPKPDPRPVNPKPSHFDDIWT